MKIVSSSDWHLDQSTSGVDRFVDTCVAIDESVDAAINMSADFYVMCGDLTDPDNARSHRAVAKGMQVMRRCHEAGTHPMFVAGNHDTIEDGSGYTTMSALRAAEIGTVFERPCCTILNGVRIIALPFTAMSGDYDPAEFIRDTYAELEIKQLPTLILGHLNLEGITSGSETTEMPRGRNVFWPLDAITECFPDALLVGGHYHKPQVFKGVNIIGSIARLRFDECGNETGFMVLEV